jgi:hypothetical protein
LKDPTITSRVEDVRDKMSDIDKTVLASWETERERRELSRKIHACDMLKALIDAERVRLINEMITYGFVDFD